MTQPANVVDLAPRTAAASPGVSPGVSPGASPAGRAADAADAEAPDALLLGVIPLPESGTAMAIVAHIIPALLETRPPGAAAGDALVIDRESRRVWSDGEQIDLTYLEFELLAQLTSAPTRVFSRAQLLATTWGGGPPTAGRTIDVHVHRLRRKLGNAGRHLVTVRRIGYMYDPTTG